MGGQKIEDTGPLTRARMPTVDQEIYAAEQKFVNKAVNDGKPFFVWFNTTRMHVWTHLKKSAEGRTGMATTSGCLYRCSRSSRRFSPRCRTIRSSGAAV